MFKSLLSYIAISLIFLSILPVSALTASISNPRMVLYQNISGNSAIEFQNSVFVNNQNPNEVLIKITPIGVWKERVVFSESNFTLQPDERKEVFYTINVEKSGYYDGDILITFSEEGTQNVLSAAQNLVVIVQDENGKVGEEVRGNPGSSGLSYFNWILGIVILVVLIVILTTLLMRRKK